MSSIKSGAGNQAAGLSAVISLRGPVPYVERLEQAALFLDISTSGFIRAAVADYASRHPELPPQLVKELLDNNNLMRTYPAARTRRPFVTAQPWLEAQPLSLNNGNGNASAPAISEG